MIMVAGAAQEVLEDQLMARTSAASRMISAVMTKLYQRTDTIRISKSIILKMEIAVSKYVYLKINQYSEATTTSSQISLENTCIGVSS